MNSIEVKVPDIGDFDAVPIIELFVKVGDSINVDDAICTLESDKATMDVPSSAAGVAGGRGCGGGGSGCRRGGRGCCCRCCSGDGVGCFDDDQHLAFGNPVAQGNPDFLDDAGGGRGHVHRGLVGFEGGDGVFSLDAVANLHEQLDDRDVGEIADVRNLHFNHAHGGLLRA